MTFKKYILLLILGSCLLFYTVAEDQEAAKEAANFDFNFNLGLGVDTFSELVAGVPTDVSYQKLLLSPDIALGKFGIGFDLVFHYLFQDGNLIIRPQDWVPDDPTFLNIVELYLAKFKYIRWGQKGEPLYAKLGSIENGLLGNGFILGGYNNTLFLPDFRIFGLSLDIDGALFNFPLVGLETFMGNIIKWDIIGIRPFVRPLVLLDIPILKNLEVGATFAMDINPFAFFTDQEKADFIAANNLPANDNTVFFWGIDFMQPILPDPLLALAVYGDVAGDKNGHTGGMLGFGGTLISIFNYGAQLRIIGEGFVPNYFNPYYDLIRPYNYALIESPELTPFFVGWYASLGTSLLDGAIALNFTLDGPFGRVVEGAEGDNNPLNFPHLAGSFVIGEGLIPGLSFTAAYDKVLIREFGQIFTPEGAVISARINYQTGPAVLSFFYELKYNPETGWAATSDNITSGFESLIKLN